MSASVQAARNAGNPVRRCHGYCDHSWLDRGTSGTRQQQQDEDDSDTNKRCTGWAVVKMAAHVYTQQVFPSSVIPRIHGPPEECFCVGMLSCTIGPRPGGSLRLSKSAWCFAYSSKHPKHIPSLVALRFPQAQQGFCSVTIRGLSKYYQDNQDAHGGKSDVHHAIHVMCAANSKIMAIRLAQIKRLLTNFIIARIVSVFI